MTTQAEPNMTVTQADPETGLSPINSDIGTGATVFNRATTDFSTSNPIAALQVAQASVAYMAGLIEKLNAPQRQKYVAVIQGQQYPTTAWWSTIGMSLGVFPHVVSVEQTINQDNEWEFEAVVSLVRDGVVVVGNVPHSANNQEALKTWGRTTASTKSMAITRAVGKAFRTGMAGLAVLAGYNPTPAEEMPQEMPQEAKPPQGPSISTPVHPDPPAPVPIPKQNNIDPTPAENFSPATQAQRDRFKELAVRAYELNMVGDGVMEAMEIFAENPQVSAGAIGAKIREWKKKISEPNIKIETTS